MSQNFDPIKDQIAKSIKEHNQTQTIDAILYNGAIILAIAATSSAAIFANCLKPAKILSGIGALLIALERALSWGGRWRYERQMRNNYLIIQAKINFYENLPPTFSEDEKKKIYLEVYSDLYDLRKREADKPGSGSQS
jgi:hypothetical protein